MPEPNVRVLIVEDDEDEREGLAEWLRRKEPVVVATAATGAKAMEMVRAAKGNYDAILMDQVLPDMDGIEVMCQIKDQFPAVQVIMVTGKDLEAGVEALRQGAYRYIVKPVNNDEIAILLRHIGEIRQLDRKVAAGEKLAEATRRISEHVLLLPKDQLLQEVANTGRDLLDAPVCIVWELDRTSGKLKVARWAGKVDKEYIRTVQIDSESEATQQFLTENKVLALAEVSQAPLYEHKQEAHERGWVSLLSAPMITQEEVVGILEVYTYQPRRFKAWEKSIVAAFAAQAATAIWNTEQLQTIDSLKEEAQYRFEFLDALHEISLDIVQELNRDELMQAIIERAATIMGREGHKGIGAAYWQCDHEKQKAVIKYSPNRKLVNKKLAFDEGLIGQVIQTGQGGYINDYHKWPQRAARFGEEDVAHLIKNLIQVPIKEGERVTAVLAVSDASGERQFNDDDVELLERFASLAAVAIHNTELYQQARRRGQILERLQQVGQEMSNLVWQEPRRSLEQIARTVCERVGADCAVVYPYDLDREGVYFDTTNVASYGFWYPLILADKPRTSEMTAQINSAGGWLDIPDVSQADSTINHSLIKKEGIQAFVGLVLQDSNGREVGVMYVNFRQPHQTSKEEERLIHGQAQEAIKAIQDRREVKSVQLPTLLKKIAGDAKELLKADVVALYQYRRGRDEEFVTPPVQLGKLRDPQPLGPKVYEDDIPALLVRAGESYYADDVTTDPFLATVSSTVEARDGQPSRFRFIEREGIRSSAGVLLRAEGENVGVMFINYREPHSFTEQLRQEISLFADQAALAIRNARVFEQTQTLNEIGQAVTEAALEPERVLDLVLERTLELVGFSKGWISLLDPLTDKLEVKAARGLKPDQWRALAKGAGITGQVAKTGRLMNVPDVSQAPGYELFFEDTRSELCAPLKYRDEVLGILNLESRRLNAFTPRDEELVTAMTNAGAVAIQNARLYEHVSQQSDALQRIVAAIGPQEEQPLSMILKEAVSLFGAQWGSFVLVDREAQELTYEAIWENGQILVDEQIPEDKRVRSWEKGITGYVARTEEAYRTGNVNDDPYYEHWYDSTRSELAVPLKDVQQRTIGVLNLESPLEDAFSQAEEDLCQNLANVAAAVVEKVALLEELGLRVTQLTALSQASQVVMASLDLDTVLREIVGQVSKMYGDISCGIRTYNADTGELGPRVQTETLVEELKVDPRPGGTTAYVLDEKALYVPDTSFDPSPGVPPVRQEFVDCGIKAVAYLPLSYQEDIKGILYLNFPETRQFMDDEKRTLQLFADQAAIAIENARLYERLARKTKSLQVLYDMGQRLASGVQLSELEIVDLIEEQATRLMDTRNMYIALYDATTDMVSFPFMRVSGEPREVPARSGGQGRTEWVIEHRKSILITTRAESKAWYEEPGREEYIGQPFSSWVGAPMMVGDEVLGVVAAYHEEEEYVYDEDDLEIITLMANQAAVALKSAQQLEIMKDLAIDLSAGFLGS